MVTNPNPGPAAPDLRAMRRQARRVWRIADPAAKCAALDALVLAVAPGAAAARLQSGHRAATLAATKALVPATRAIALRCLEPGRPPRPVLVHPQRLAVRSVGTARGRAALLHAIAHIEFNAINLALDAIWRYDRMPAAFALDWLAVAADEARHFRLLEQELARCGSAYGDFDAHDGLWAMARRTASDLTARMALVPRVLEARGLDATPAIQQRLQQAGEGRAVAVLQTILDDEIGHVAIGNHWFQRLCHAREQDPELLFRELMARFDAPRPRGRLNRAARLAAGFSETEIDWLSA